MGRHSRTARVRVRAAVAAGLVGVGALGWAGIAQAEPALVAGTPCTAAARACVDLATRQAWLIDGDKVLRGPVPVSTGAAGRETPRGDHLVEWKDKDHRSSEFDAPMPYAVFFAAGGIAFHEGNLGAPSAGCVRLAHGDASAFYDFLEVGDGVQVR